jgi:hypothetical protein
MRRLALLCCLAAAVLAASVGLRPASALPFTVNSAEGTGREPAETVDSLLAGGPWQWGSADLLREIDGWRKACDAAPVADCGGLALSYSRRAALLEGDPQRAAVLYREACRDGYLWACYQLADLARSGQGMLPDAEAAARLLEHACVGGESRACLRWGQMLERGEGIPADPARAESLFEAECAASRTAGCWRLGLFLAERRVDGDAEGAVRLREAFRRGCTGGSGDSCRRLAELLETDGEMREAARYFGRACERNDFAGCFRWAEYLESGAGGSEPDPEFAQKLYRKACGGGVEAACDRVARPAD